jgi:cbb3-type cytochrome oxidase subunit 3
MRSANAENPSLCDSRANRLKFFALFAKTFAFIAVKLFFYRKERKAGAENAKKKSLFYCF